jgi:DNA-directed RNA polymerase subunit omega
MTHVPLEDLMDKVDSKYRLVIITAKRSRQLNQGAAPTVQSKAYKPTYVALEEMAAGKIEYTAAPIEEVAKAGVFAEAVKPTWFREITPEAVTAEEEEEEEAEQETTEEAAPAEAEEEVAEVVPAEAEGEFVDLDQIEKAAEEEEEG